MLQKEIEEDVKEEERERKEDLGLREQRERGIWELRNERKRDWGQRRGNKRQGAFPHQIRSDGPN